MTEEDITVNSLNRRFTDHVDQVSRELQALHANDINAEEAVRKVSANLNEFKMEFKLHDLRETEYRKAQTRLFESWLGVVQDLQKVFSGFEGKLDRVIETQNISELEMQPIKGFKNWIVFSVKVAGVISALVGAVAAISLLVQKAIVSGALPWLT